MTLDATRSPISSANAGPDASVSEERRLLAARGARAVTLQRFGGPEVLQVVRESVPDPKPGEVLVRVRATSVNPIDWKIRRGTMRWMSGSKFPKRVGGEVVGTVSAVGAGVSFPVVGDRVAGFAAMGAGTFADVVRVPAESLVRLETDVSFEAVAAGLVGVTALQAVRDVASARAGMRVLVTGASGAVGLLALQLLRESNVETVAIGSKRGVLLARELGAVESYDYRERTVSSLRGPFDAILDFAGSLRFRDAAPLLSPRGVHADPVPTPARLVGQTLANLVRRRRWKPVLTKPAIADVVEVVRRVERGSLRVFVDETFELNDVVAAYRRAEQGGVLGKVVITVDEEPRSTRPS